MQVPVDLEVAEPPAKIQILSNILLAPPTCQANYTSSLPSTSTGGVTTTLVGTQDKILLKQKNLQQIASTSQTDEMVTPRKRKLLNKLKNTQRVSRERKKGFIFTKKTFPKR